MKRYVHTRRGRTYTINCGLRRVRLGVRVSVSVRVGVGVRVRVGVGVRVGCLDNDLHTLFHT